MRNVLYWIVILAALGVGGFLIYQKALPQCAKVLHYSIGRFDNNFGVNQGTFKADILAAGHVWEKALASSKGGNQKILFEYDPKAKFTVNLIYDQRQKETIQKQKAESGLNNTESVFRDLDAQFAALNATYKERVVAHDKSSAGFDSANSKYAAEVEYWNSRGGAPKAQYQNLQEEKQSLNSQIADLNKDAEDINNMAAQLKELLDRRNRAAEAYNTLVATYNKQYGTGLEFDQAEYTGSNINVYEFTTENDLKLALTHELGHALGMDHVENQKSIMYFETTGKDSSAIIPTTEDIAELKRVCKTW